MTAADIIEQSQLMMWKLANRAAPQFADTPEDHFQTLAVAILTNHHRYDPERGALTNFVRMLSVNIVYQAKLAKRRAVRSAAVSTDELVDVGCEVVDRRAPNPVAVAETRDAYEVVAAKLALLNERERACVVGRFGLNSVEARTVDEMADALGMWPGNVTSYTQAGLQKLAGLMGADVGQVSTFGLGLVAKER